MNSKKYRITIDTTAGQSYFFDVYDLQDVTRYADAIAAGKGVTFELGTHIHAIPPRIIKHFEAMRIHS